MTLLTDVSSQCQPSHVPRLAEERTLPSHRFSRLPGHAAIPVQCSSGHASPLQSSPHGLTRFNTLPSTEAERALLTCCGSLHWARRLVAHRPFPDLDALLAAADEAVYDFAPADLDEALSRESLPLTPHGSYSVAHTALGAAHGAYESRFGHAFVICLDDYGPAEALDQLLAGIRSRLGNDPEEERVLSWDELRRLARGRLARLVRSLDARTEPQEAIDPQEPADSGRPDSASDSPYVAV
ncbi:2-oxo-4-hydroxy-4-carboxy-5-ureidoimidazoline decarboxylase [Streptomyces sp. NPDC051956]|uniref:2-oxo-4-hydroxy-4-carboxy-5-ureidoimidazoline decarboxylase n=1 Tax=Streptomyces sp. NPDC051956 TaxID=3365677 RepID=UPI0037D10F4C